MMNAMERINAINAIACMAEKEILNQTGLNMRVIVVGARTEKKIEDLLGIVANALGMTMADYGVSTKQRSYVDMRYLACYFLKQYYPEMTLADMAKLVGYKLHTDALNAIQMVERLKRTDGRGFRDVYDIVLNAVTQWEAE